MHRYLESILARRRERVEADRAGAPADLLEASLPIPRRGGDAADLVRRSGGFIVAEIKRASPSKGPFAETVDVPARARAYERGGAGALSVLCEPDFFKGSREDVREAARAVALPVLCKDFVVDPYQLLQARADGAAWVLLIARVLGNELPAFVREALRLGLEPLVEVHSEEDLRRSAGCGARLLGLNARDLDTFEVDLDAVKRLAGLLPEGCACIAESGIRDAADLLALRDAGAHGFLIGEALMRVEDPAALLTSFGRALRRHEASVGAPPTGQEHTPEPMEMLGPMC